MLFAALLFTAVAAASDAAATINPLAPAEQGQLQCYDPKVVKKTCQSIAGYRRTGPGAYDNQATVAIGNGITLQTNTPVTVKDGAVCGAIRAEDVKVGILTVGGRTLSPDEAKPMLERIAQAMAALIGKEICTRYEPSGTDLIATATIGGVDRPEATKVRWIHPGDGYTVSR